MDKKKADKISKTLSYVLRHNPEHLKIKLDAKGWTDTQILLENLKTEFSQLDLETLKYVAINNEKNRFAFSEDFSKIKANHGHSIKIDLDIRSTEPPEILFHGTATRFLKAIQKEGLVKRSRQLVHLSFKLEKAKSVATRHGVPAILKIRAKEMHDIGYEFFLSENEVWLTDHVPVKYIDFK